MRYLELMCGFGSESVFPISANSLPLLHPSSKETQTLRLPPQLYLNTMTSPPPGQDPRPPLRRIRFTIKRLHPLRLLLDLVPKRRIRTHHLIFCRPSDIAPLMRPPNEAQQPCSTNPTSPPSRPLMKIDSTASNPSISTFDCREAERRDESYAESDADAPDVASIRRPPIA